MTVDAIARRFTVPTLWMTRSADDMAAEGWPAVEVRHVDGTQRAAYRTATGDAWYVTVDGLFHADLTDAPYGAPGLSLLGMTSRKAGGRVHEIMRTLTLDFFDRTVRGSDRPSTLDVPPWPDVHIDARR